MSDNKQDNRPSWAVPVPKDIKPLIFISSPRVGEKRRSMVLSERPIGVMTHWFRNRTVRCTKNEGECEACGKAALRYKSYMAGWDLDSRKYVLIEFTAQAAIDNPKTLGDDGPSLRGLNVVTSRKGNSNAGRLLVEFFTDPKRDAASVPEPFDVQAALERIWNGETRVRRPEEPPPAPRPEDPEEGINAIPLPR